MMAHPEHIFEKDISIFDTYVERSTEREIIENADLFRLVFWKILYDSNVELDRSSGSLSLKDRKLTLKHMRHIFDEVEGCVDQLRTFYLTCIQEKRSITFLELFDEKRCDDMSFFREDSDKTITCHSLKGEGCVYTGWLNKIIKPCLTSLSEFYRLEISEKRVHRKKFYNNNCVIGEFNAFTIQYQHICPYTITPSPISKRNDLQNLLYSSYVNQDEYCDVTFVANDGFIKVHSVIILMLGGDVFKKMLSSNMKEGLNKEISLSCYSFKIVQQFVEYLYFGVEGLSFDEWIKTDFPVTDLLHFAHSHSIDDLLTHCTNYFSLISTKEHTEMIQKLATLYENDYLQNVASKLQKSVSDDR